MLLVFLTPAGPLPAPVPWENFFGRTSRIASTSASMLSGISASPMFLPLGHSDHVGRHGCAHSLFPVRTSVWTNFHPQLRFGWKTWNSYIDEEDNIADGVFGGNDDRLNSRVVGATNLLNRLLMEVYEFHISWDQTDDSPNALNRLLMEHEVMQVHISWD